jgi:thioredoxin-related protein
MMSQASKEKQMSKMRSFPLVLPGWLLPGLLMLTLLLTMPALATDTPSREGRLIGAMMAEHPSWFKESFLDLTEDVAEAAELGRHLILMMDMDGCPYCYKMINENFANAPYRDFIQENFDVIAVNVRGDLMVSVTEDLALSERQLAEYFGARFTPTVIFLDSTNTPVARVSGYRNVEDFKVVLDYVHERAYRHMALNEYMAARQTDDFYAFRQDPLIHSVADLSALADEPLALLFEDSACVACDALHDTHFADPAVRDILERLKVVRIDVRSDSPLVGPTGEATTHADLARALGIEYRPSLVLFDRGREIVRIESMLYRYHFTGILEYVADRHYERFPRSPFAYINAKTAELTAMGIDVVIAE